nr:MAG TPA: tail protein [Herelleviridae sp.]
MKGELFINGEDAYLQWGISMDDTSLSELMTPPANKAFIENESRLQHGKQVLVANQKLDQRNLTLQINLTAPTEEQFFARYSSFCKVLATGVLHIQTKYQPGVVYKTIYLSCGQFSQFMRGIGKFSLKLNEPNPNDRTE